MKFNFFSSGEEVHFDNYYKYEIIFNNSQYKPYDIDLSKFLLEEGVDIESLEQIKSSSNYDSVKISHALEPFKERFVWIGGEIYFISQDYLKKIKNHKVKFVATTVLIDEFGGSNGDGVPDPKDSYEINFDLYNSNYKRSVPISQAIKVGDYDRFRISLSAQKSSRHIFDLILVYNENKEIVIPNVMFKYLN